MAEQEQKKPTHKESAAEEAEVDTSATTEEGKQTVDALDELLDEIDGVLEENAEEFVRNYVQKGGQ